MGACLTGRCVSRSAFFWKNLSWLSCSRPRIRAEESRPSRAPTPGASGPIRWVCGWRQAARQGACHARCPELPLGPGLLLRAGSSPAPVSRTCVLGACHLGVIPGPGPSPLALHTLSRRLCTNQQSSFTLTHCSPWKTPSEEKLPIPDAITQADAITHTPLMSPPAIRDLVTHPPLMSSQQRRPPRGHGRSQGQGKSQCVSTHDLAHSAGSRKHVEPWQQLARQATKAFGG